MFGQTVAILMARDATRRHVTEAQREPAAGGRRRAARALQAAAHRLDPHVAAAPRPALGQ